MESAKKIQKQLSTEISLKNGFSKLSLIAGVDMAIQHGGTEGIAGVIVFSFPELNVVEQKQASHKINYPYIPGLLSFRESPVLLEALKKIENEPDLIIFDGQGIAHPRKLGIASHMGLLLNKPTIGCAKSLLFGKYREPAERKGSISELMDGKIKIGMVVRTRDSVKPVFVSPGHKIDLKTSVKIILQCSDGYRIPKPTREADRYVESLKSKHL